MDLLVSGKTGINLERLLISSLFNNITRKYVVRYFKRFINIQLSPQQKNAFSSQSIRILTERKLLAYSILHSVQQAIENKTLKPDIAAAIFKLWANALGVPREKSQAVRQFHDQYGCNPPWFLVISPGHACNLHCRDCYASSEPDGNKLSWDIVQRLLHDARKLWDIKLVVFSGGEPFAYHSQGKDILDLVEQHPECLFLVFTNGTLINAHTASRIARLKNITPAISVEGLRNATEDRRGTGTFSRVLEAMESMRTEGAPFGISITVNRYNQQQVISDEFLDLFFNQLGAFYAFYFQYMPIGRNATFDSMPAAAQRVEFWRKIWDIIEKKSLFLIDFWNHGPLAEGCIAAGRDGGYLYIDWNGKVMPCVFAPYSAGNINELYAQGRQINSLWEAPFFVEIRKWQIQHGYGNKNPVIGGNWLRPCPYRDHHSQFLKWIRLHSAEPEDIAAAQILADHDYHEKMIKYDEELANLFDPIWQREYMT